METIKSIMILAMLCFFSNANAQQKLLKIGDTVPDVEITDILNSPMKRARLSDFKGKLVIFDFWSTACYSCISDMPKMDSLQKTFKDQIIIMPVYPMDKINQEERIRINSFWNTNKYTKRTSLTHVLDTTFRKLFGYRVAYQVWIDSNRVLRAITSPEYVNKTEIQKMLDGIYPKWEVEIKESSYTKPVSAFLSRPEFSELKKQNYSFFTPYLRGIDRFLDVDTTNSHTLVSYKNTSILGFYRSYLVANNLTVLNTILEVQDSIRYFKKGYLNEWLRDNSYCYELKLNRKIAQHDLANYIREDANKYFGLNARIENRNVNCWILKKIKSRSQAIKEEGVFKLSVQDFYNQVRNEQKNYLWQIGKRALPVLDETGSKSDVMLSYPKLLNFANIPAVRKVLQSQGYDLVEEKRMQKMFVISETK